MHFFIARIIVGFAAGRIDHDLSRRVSGSRINRDFPLLDGEGAVNQMQGGVEGPMQRAVRGIDRENELAGRGIAGSKCGAGAQDAAGGDGDCQCDDQERGPAP